MHQFLKERKAKELFIVCRIDDYGKSPTLNSRGGLVPLTSYGNKGGYLWYTLKQANDAARHMVDKFPGQQYGVFRLTTIAEEAVRVAPIKVTVVG